MHVTTLMHCATFAEWAELWESVRRLRFGVNKEVCVQRLRGVVGLYSGKLGLRPGR